MALVAHNGFVIVGDILGSEYLGNTSGFKVLSKVFVDVIGSNMYVIQYGEVKEGENKFTPYGGGKDLGLMSMDDVKRSYSKKWTKEPEVKDGDVLRSKNSEHIFVVRGTHMNEPKLYRVTGGDNMFDCLGNYEARFGKLVVMTTGYGDSGRRFSKALVSEDHTGNGVL